MDKEKELVYSAEYEKPEMKIPISKPSSEAEERLSQQFRELVKKAEEESVYLVWPGKEEKGSALIKLAKEFSLVSETDVKIYKTLGEITIWFYFSSGFMAGNEKNSLAKLMLLADDVDIIAKPRNSPEWCDYVIVLTLYTHRHFVGGSEITRYYP